VVLDSFQRPRRTLWRDANRRRSGWHVARRGSNEMIMAMTRVQFLGCDGCNSAEDARNSERAWVAAVAGRLSKSTVGEVK
jgi:hypothetical protein